MAYSINVYRCPSPTASISDAEDIKQNREVLYQFAIFTIVNEILIFKNRGISA